jgi:Pyruvate/2-oxoacid:ferredoxin oxidoreductase delta subunit
MTAASPLPVALRVVLYEGLGSRPLSNRFDMVERLLDKGYAVTAARGHQLMAREFDGGERGDGGAARHVHDALLVLARFTEEKPSEAEGDDGRARVFFREVDGLESDRVVQIVEEVAESVHAPKPGAWKPWFPVIDYSRCTNCMQCLTFCLFDVYGVSSEQKIQVQHATRCKTDCPACSRVCPEVAILFPKYRAGPINGDVVNQADVEREKLKVDISALLGGDIYSALRQRSEHARTRFGKERDDKRALEERKKCLAKLQQDLDIPPEILAALPSADAIRERTARAVAASNAGVYPAVNEDRES